MTNAEKAQAARDAANQVDLTKFDFDALIKAQPTTSDAALSGILRGAKVSTVTEKEVESMTIGVSNTSLKVGMIFRIIALRKVHSVIQTTGLENTSLLAIVRNPEGEETPVYVSTLFRTPPVQQPANADEDNRYTDAQLKFNMGVLHDSAGLSVPKRLERLGMGWLTVTDTMSFTVKSKRRKAGNLPGQEVGSDIEFTSKVYAIKHCAEDGTVIED